MVKEVSIGTGLALLIFLALQGFNVFPVVILAGLAVFLLVLLDNRGLGGIKYNANSVNSDSITFASIGGQERAKNELLEALDFVVKRKEIVHFGIRPLKGILLSGPPGTGKTLLARAAACYTDSIFFAASGSEFIEMYAGVGAKRVRQMFQETRRRARQQKKKSGIVFIDEIDVLGAKRGQVSSHMEYDQTLNQLLVEMDGLSHVDDIQLLVLAATNRIEGLDAALLRPGRFDRIVKVDLPDRKGRKHILEIHMKNKQLHEDVNLEIIAGETFGFSGAHLESLANEAAIFALRKGTKKIRQEHFLEAIEKVLLGEKAEKIPSKQEKERVSIHECGHALISEILQPGSVAGITITPRGQALGYMRQNVEEDRYLHTEEEIRRSIAVKIAGSVAEHEILGSKSTGAIQDLKEAHNLGKLLVKSGMSDLGFVDPDDLPQHLLHTTLSEILQEIQKKVLETIITNQETLEKMSHKLLLQENISGKEIREIIGQNVEARVF